MSWSHGPVVEDVFPIENGDSPGLAMLDFWSVTPSWSQILGPKGLSQKLAKKRWLALPPPLLLSIILVG